MLEQISGAVDGPLADAVEGGTATPLAGGDLSGEADIVVEQRGHVVPELAGADDGGKFQVVFDAAVVEVGRADDGEFVVDADGLGVKDDGLALVDLDAVGQEKLVKGMSGGDEEVDIAAPGKHEADAHAALGGVAEGLDEIIRRGEVGHREIDAFFGGGEQEMQAVFQWAADGGDGGEQAEVAVVEWMEVFGASDASAGVNVTPGVGEGVPDMSGGRSEDADGVVAPEIAVVAGCGDDPRARVFARRRLARRGRRYRRRWRGVCGDRD